MINGTTVTINNKKLTIGTQVRIAGETFRVMNIYPEAQSIFFAKVLKNGKLAKPGKDTMGTYTYTEIAHWMDLGAITT